MFQTIKAFLPTRIETSSGHIVCMCSTLGLSRLKYTNFTFQTIKAFLPSMIETNHDHIVGMCSTLGILGLEYTKFTFQIIKDGRI